MSLHFPSDKLTLNLTEFTKIKIDRADDIFWQDFFSIFTVVFYVLFTRQQSFLQKKFFQNFICQKKFFLKGSKHKNGKNRYKSIQIYKIFCKIHVSTPPKIFFCWKKIFFCDRVKTKLLRVNTPLTIFTLSLFVTIFLVDLTKMMSGQNQGTKLSIWRAIWSFCKVDFLVCIFFQRFENLRLRALKKFFVQITSKLFPIG
jgi:hypothetical protein